MSRTHAEIRYEEGCFVLRDLGSTNGTRVNGKALDKLADHRLSTNDVVELARGAVALRFRQSEETMEIEAGELEPLAAPAIRVDEQARDVWVGGVKLEPPLPFRDFEVLLVLYRNREKACSKDELATAWGGEFVTDEQIEQSIYRVRKRVELNPSTPTRIVTVRGYGYKLTTPTQG